MATLYTQAENNTRKTFFLIFLFLILIIGLGWVFSLILDSQIILFLAIFFSVLLSFTSYWHSDKIVLSMAKARLIAKEDNPELYRIVENLAITAGLPVPKIYIINEDQPNAFATGRNPEKAVVAVTQGLLDKLERVELEGVIAHELAHIGNRDILLGTVIIVLAGIAAMLSHSFLRISLYSGRNRKGSGALIIIGLIAALLAPLAASLIRMAISRKREFLADASGALLTRHPEGLARALEKISQDSTSLRVASNSFAHLFISSPFKSEEKRNWFTKLFLTHPPIEERVNALRGMEI